MKEIGIAELKATLSAQIAEVRRGATITVLDRKTPVATIVPYQSSGEPLQVRPAARKVRIGKIAMPRAPIATGDIVELLLEDRRTR